MSLLNENLDLTPEDLLLRWTNPGEIEILKAFVRRFLLSYEYKDYPMEIAAICYKNGSAHEVSLTINSEKIYGTQTFWTTFDENFVIGGVIAALNIVCEKEKHDISFGWRDDAKRFYLRHGIHKEYVNIKTGY